MEGPRLAEGGGTDVAFARGQQLGGFGQGATNVHAEDAGAFLQAPQDLELLWR